MAVLATVTATVPTDTQAKITVFEDSTGDGTADSQQTNLILDGVGDYHFPDLVGDSTYDYWIECSLETFDEENVRPSIDSISVDTEPPKANSGLTATTTLNGQSAYATVYEDTNSDGSVDNRITIPLDDGTATYEFPSLSGERTNDHWIRVSLTSDTTSQPSVDSVTLEPKLATTDPGSVTATSASSLSPNDISSLLETGQVSVASGALLTTPTESISDGGGVVSNAQSVILSAVDTTRSSETALVTDSSGTILQTTEETVWDVPGSITPTVTSSLSANESAALTAIPVITDSLASVVVAEPETLTDAAGVVTSASGTTVTASDASSTVGNPVITGVVATPTTTAEIVEQIISGVVELDGSGVQGAVIYVINTDDDTIEAVETTDSNGEYAVTVPATPLYHVTVQYDSGNQKYNALSKPYVK